MGGPPPVPSDALNMPELPEEDANTYNDLYEHNGEDDAFNDMYHDANDDENDESDDDHLGAMYGKENVITPSGGNKDEDQDEYEDQDEFYEKPAHNVTAGM